MKIREFPKEDLPRERLARLGANNLSNLELLSIIIGSGTKNKSVLEISSKLLSKYDLKKLSQSGLATLQKEEGIGEVNASKIIACMELGRRAGFPKNVQFKKISCAKDVADIFLPEMRLLEEENFRVVFLDSKNKISGSKTIFVGTLNESVIHPREIFKSAVLESSANIILIHNHPSGDTSPSKEDIRSTKDLVRSGEILGISVLDHIILGGNSFFSFLESGLLD